MYAIVSTKTKKHRVQMESVACGPGRSMLPYTMPVEYSAGTKSSSSETTRLLNADPPNSDDERTEWEDDVVLNTDKDQERECDVTDGTDDELAIKTVNANHCLLHNDPFKFPNCEACKKAKTTRGKHYRQYKDKVITGWGDLMTCDHCDAK